MAWLVGFFVVVLFSGLLALFTAAALAIRRDFKERFDRIDSRLCEDAERLLQHLPHR